MSQYYVSQGVSSRATGSIATLNATPAPLHKPDLSLYNRGELKSSYNRQQPPPNPGDPGGDGPLLRVVDQLNVQIAATSMPTPDLSLYNRGALTSSYNRVQPRPEPISTAYRFKVFDEHFEVSDPKHDELHVPKEVMTEIENLGKKGFSKEFVDSFLTAVRSGQRHNLSQPQLEILDKLMHRHISTPGKKAEEKKEWAKAPESTLVLLPVEESKLNRYASALGEGFDELKAQFEEHYNRMRNDERYSELSNAEIKAQLLDSLKSEAENAEKALKRKMEKMGIESKDEPEVSDIETDDEDEKEITVPHMIRPSQWQSMDTSRQNEILDFMYEAHVNAGGDKQDNVTRSNRKFIKSPNNKWIQLRQVKESMNKASDNHFYLDVMKRRLRKP